MEPNRIVWDPYAPYGTRITLGPFCTDPIPLLHSMGIHMDPYRTKCTNLQ